MCIRDRVVVALEQGGEMSVFGFQAGNQLAVLREHDGLLRDPVEGGLRGAGGPARN